MQLVILASAHKHGIAPEDMLHAYRNAFRTIDQDTVTIFIGSNTHGNLIEIAVVQKGNQIQIVHAMKARAKFLK